MIKVTGGILLLIIWGILHEDVIFLHIVDSNTK